MIWLQFLATALVIVLAGVPLARYGDVLGEKTGLGRSWIGVVLVAATTSLPELFTGFGATALAALPDIAVGDVVGSCMFNLLILSMMDAIQPEPISARAHQGHALSIGFGLLLIGVAGLGLIGGARMPALGWVGAHSLVLITLYFVAMRVIFKHEQHRREREVREVAEKLLTSQAHPPESNLLPRQCDTPPDKRFPKDVQQKKREPRAENPVPAGTERLESHERGMKILPILQHPERGADAAGQHADGRQPSNSPAPVAAIHRAKPQPRAQRTQSSCTPFSIQQHGSHQKQGTQKDDACGQEPHHHGLGLGGGGERRDGYPRCQEQQQSTRPEQRNRTAQSQRRNPIRLRPFAPFKTVGR
jgi:Ca2+/Na+ antiporter